MSTLPRPTVAPLDGYVMGIHAWVPVTIPGLAEPDAATRYEGYRPDTELEVGDYPCSVDTEAGPAVGTCTIWNEEYDDATGEWRPTPVLVAVHGLTVVSALLTAEALEQAGLDAASLIAGDHVPASTVRAVEQVTGSRRTTGQVVDSTSAAWCRSTLRRWAMRRAPATGPSGP